MGVVLPKLSSSLVDFSTLFSFLIFTYEFWIKLVFTRGLVKGLKRGHRGEALLNYIKSIIVIFINYYAF